jgi:hypothetical protein
LHPKGRSTAEDGEAPSILFSRCKAGLLPGGGKWSGLRHCNPAQGGPDLSHKNFVGRAARRFWQIALKGKAAESGPLTGKVVRYV